MLHYGKNLVFYEGGGGISLNCLPTASFSKKNSVLWKRTVHVTLSVN